MIGEADELDGTDSTVVHNSDENTMITDEKPWARVAHMAAFSQTTPYQRPTFRVASASAMSVIGTAGASSPSASLSICGGKGR
jgi:hypothetical protein